MCLLESDFRCFFSCFQDLLHHRYWSRSPEAQPAGGHDPLPHRRGTRSGMWVLEMKVTCLSSPVSLHPGEGLWVAEWCRLSSCTICTYLQSWVQTIAPFVSGNKLNGHCAVGGARRGRGPAYSSELRSSTAIVITLFICIVGEPKGPFQTWVLLC